MCVREREREHLVVIFDAHADTVEHDGDENGALGVPTLDE